MVRTELEPELRDAVVGVPAVDVAAAFFGLHEAGGAQDLQVGAGGCERLARGLRELVDGFLAVCKQAHNPEAGGTGEGLADQGELLE